MAASAMFGACCARRGIPRGAAPVTCRRSSIRAWSTKYTIASWSMPAMPGSTSGRSISTSRRSSIRRISPSPLTPRSAGRCAWAIGCRRSRPKRRLLENYYPENYATGGMFAGLDPLGDLATKTERTFAALAQARHIESGHGQLVLSVSAAGLAFAGGPVVAGKDNVRRILLINSDAEAVRGKLELFPRRGERRAPRRRDGPSRRGVLAAASSARQAVGAISSASSSRCPPARGVETDRAARGDRRRPR